MRKHRLYIVQMEHHDGVMFHCHYCPAGIAVERHVLLELFTKNGQNLVGVGFGAWSICNGR